LTDPLEKLSLGRRKFCLGRWLGMTAFGEVSPALIDLDQPQASTEVAAEEALELEQLDARATLETATQVALRNEIQEVVPFLTGLAPGIAALNVGGSQSHPYLEALERRVDAFLADPFDPYKVVLEAALEVAVGFYEREGFGLHLPSARCELGLDDGGEPCPPSRPAVNGALEVRSAGLVVARLTLRASKLWREEICALTYATLHELVVHGFAAPHARGSVDAFAEGWMDFVAFQLHERLKLGRLPQRSPLTTDFPAAQQGYHAFIAHAARIEEKPLLQAGRVAAEMAQDALFGEFSSDDDARAAMWAFSVALNRSEIDSSRRSDFCELIGQDTMGTRILPGFVLAARAVQAVSDPAEKLQIASDFVEACP
jgi:hypothetical protein